MGASTRRVAATAAAALLGAGLAACESTQEKSARLAKQAKGLDVEEGLKVGAANAAVQVRDTAIVADANGTAAVVVLRNGGGAQADVPILIDVLDADGRSLFRNDVPGLQRSLTHASIVPADDDVIWVNDQIVAAGEPATVKARVGKAEQPAPGRMPKLTVDGLEIQRDPTSGVQATGFVRNGGSEEQRRVIVAIVARRGDRVTAAGRGVVQRVKAGGRAAFRAFLIGDPRDAALSAVASPGAEGEALGNGPSEGDVETGGASS